MTVNVFFKKTREQIHIMKEKEKKLQKENFRSLKQTYKQTQKVRSQSQERKRSDAARLRTSDTVGVTEKSGLRTGRLTPGLRSFLCLHSEEIAPHPLRLNTGDSFCEKDNTVSPWIGRHKAGEGRDDSLKIKVSWLIYSMLRSPVASLTQLYGR